MRTPMWMRALVGVWAVWLVAVLSAPSLHACPLHNRGHAATSAQQNAGHHAHGAPAQPASDSHAQCSCIGEGCCPPSAVLPVATASPRSAVVLVMSAALAEHESVARTSPSEFLPFANGPPA